MDRCARWKNRNLPNFVTLNPYFRKYKIQFLETDIFQNNNFFEFSPLRDPQSTEKCALHPPMMNTNGNKYHDYCIIR